jgi:NitT/TauT family transport system permease protein/taurine transport system permease protein
MLTSAAGIGYLVTRYRTILDSPHVFGAIVMILLLSILFDTFARAIERRTMVWQTAGRRQREGEVAEPGGTHGTRAGVSLQVSSPGQPEGLIRDPSLQILRTS